MPDFKTSWIIGLDIGQAHDFTALVAVERTKRPKAKAVYDVRVIERLPLGVPYPQMIEMVQKFVDRSPLNKARMIIDYTGVGRPVFDMVQAAGFSCRCSPLLITAGHRWTEDTDGVYHVPKKDLVSTVQVLLGAERLRIAKKLEHMPTLQKEMLNFKVKITKSANETFGCLVAGTMISTSRGLVPIENVVAGDCVLTRKGYRRVAWSGETKRTNLLTELNTVAGKLVGTSNHLVWTVNRGWVRFDCVGVHDQLLLRESLTCQRSAPKQKSFGSTATSTESNHQQNTLRAKDISKKNLDCIGKFGSFTTDQYQRGTTFITLTATQLITIFQILNASQRQTTVTDINREGLGLVSSVELSLLGRTAAATTARDFVSPKSRCRSLALSASIAERNLEQRTRPLFSALPCAGKPIDTSNEVGQRIAQGAAFHSSPNTRFQSSVRASAPPNTVSVNDVPVYDLSVEGEHEFFANGVLVHNSWREGDHDDLVLAMAMAVWYGENVGIGDVSGIGVPAEGEGSIWCGAPEDILGVRV